MGTAAIGRKKTSLNGAKATTGWSKAAGGETQTSRNEAG
jgi:hypothetical protein